MQERKHGCLPPFLHGFLKPKVQDEAIEKQEPLNSGWIYRGWRYYEHGGEKILLQPDYVRYIDGNQIVVYKKGGVTKNLRPGYIPGTDIVIRGGESMEEIDSTPNEFDKDLLCRLLGDLRN